MQSIKAKEMDVEVSKSVEMVESHGEVFCLTIAMPRNSRLYEEEFKRSYKMLRLDELNQQFKLAGYSAHIAKLSIFDRQNLYTNFWQKLKMFSNLIISMIDMLNKFQRSCQSALSTIQVAVGFLKNRLFDDALKNFIAIKSISIYMKESSTGMQEMCSEDFDSFSELFDQILTEKTQVRNYVKKGHDDRREAEAKRKVLHAQMKEINETKEKVANKWKDTIEKIEKVSSQTDEIDSNFKKSISEVELAHKNQIDELKSKQNEELIKAKEEIRKIQNNNREKLKTMLVKIEQMFFNNIEYCEREFRNQSKANKIEYDQTIQKENSKFKSKINTINEEYKLSLNKIEQNYSNDVKACEVTYDQVCRNVNVEYVKSIDKNKLQFEYEIEQNQQKYDNKVKEAKQKFEERRRHAFFWKRRDIDQEETEFITRITSKKQEADKNSASKCKHNGEKAHILKEDKLKAAEKQKVELLQNAQAQKNAQKSDATNLKDSKENEVRISLKTVQDHAEKMKTEKDSLIKQSYDQARENAKREKERLLATAKYAEENFDNKTELEYRKLVAMQEEKLKAANEGEKSKIKQLAATHEKDIRETKEVIKGLNNMLSEHEHVLKAIETEKADCENETAELTKDICSINGNIKNDENIQYLLENALPSIEYINLTIQSVSKFWKHIESYCQDIEASLFNKKVSDMQNNQSDRREKIFGARGFKIDILLLMIKWTIINDICSVVSDNLVLLQEYFNKLIIESPTKKESQVIINELLKKIQTFSTDA